MLGVRPGNYAWPVDVLTDYTGRVSPGGPAMRRELDALAISKVSVGPMDNNAYLLVCSHTGDALLVDAANEPDRLLDLVDHEVDRERLATVVTTHLHADHWQALEVVTRACRVRTLAHRLDAPDLPVAPDATLEDGETVRVGEAVLEVIHLVGHTPGSVALLYRDPSGEPHLFSGDSLFPGGPGRTTSPKDFASLMDDLEAKVFGRLPDSTWVYPGHGADTTLAAERPHLVEWRARGW